MASCDLCARIKTTKARSAIELIKKVYYQDDVPWYVGFSGGKDSSVLVKLIFNALKECSSLHKKVTILYCDTGVEIPTMRKLVIATLRRLRNDAHKLDLPIELKIARPRLADRYFVKVIGRGYPPPTNKFRWCTDRLRINPINAIINAQRTNKIIALGVRLGESSERDKTIFRHSTENRYFLRQRGSSTSKIFSPIIDFSVKDVWSVLADLPFPEAIDAKRLAKIYKDAGSECPIIRDSKGTPCGQGRFGCWTCTVVRKDKSVTSLVEEGYDNLAPLLSFRNWLMQIRDNKDYRASYRRNGVKGLGPITLKGRKAILKKLLKAQQESRYTLVGRAELETIKALWREDLGNSKYRE